MSSTPAKRSARGASAAGGGGGNGGGGGSGGGGGGGGGGAKKRPRSAAAEDPRDAQLRELRAKLAASEAAAKAQAAAAAEKAVEKATCAICADIWELPVQAPGCGHVCCKACLMSVAELKNECPQCRKQLFAPAPHIADEMFPSFASKSAFELPVGVPLRDMADEARAKQPRPALAAERSQVAAERLLRLLPCHVIGPGPVDDHVWSLCLDITQPADARLCDSRGRSLLWWACHNGQFTVARMLIKAGADVNAADTHYKRTPLMGCVGFKYSQKVLKALLDKRPNLFATSADGETALSLVEKYLYMNEDFMCDYLLMLTEAGVFKGKVPPSHLAQAIATALSKRVGVK